MTLVQWQPFREMELLRRQMDRLLEDIDTLSGPSPSKQHNWIPAIETIEANDSIVLKAQIPGVRAEDLDVQVSRNGVLIAGEYRQEEQPDRTHSEFHYGRFRRVVPLSTAVKNTEASARFKDGILQLTLPKVEPEVNRVHRVQISNRADSVSSIESNAESIPLNASEPDSSAKHS
ncbi:MAG: Hsp20/alpha crystallin family protein [Leptolyngbya sp. SIO4C1]|nr:Hsp20/alpha crystallin family protein [Leptolyngbya sp. SIO4C1]